MTSHLQVATAPELEALSIGQVMVDPKDRLYRKVNAIHWRVEAGMLWSVEEMVKRGPFTLLAPVPTEEQVRDVAYRACLNMPVADVITRDLMPLLRASR